MDMKKEELMYRTVEGECKQNVRLEAEMSVSEAEAELVKILHAESSTVVRNTEVQNERVVVNGETVFRILCQNEDEDVRLLTTKVPFSEVADMKSCNEDMQVVTTVKMQHSDAKQLGPRKINAKAGIELVMVAYDTKNKMYVTEIAENGVEERKENVSFMQSCGKYQRRFEVREQVEIAKENPSVYEILRVDGKVSAEGYKVVNHKVVVNALLNAVILYVDDSAYQICTASLSIPFTEIFDIENVEEDWFILQNMVAENISFEVEADERGEMRLVHLCCDANYTADMYRPMHCSFITDCYGVCKKTDMQTEKIPTFFQKGSLNGQIGIKGQIEIGDNPKVAQVYYLQAEPKVESAVVNDGTCQVRGSADIRVYYITEDSSCKLAVLQKNIPFSESFACDTNQANVVLQVKASGISYTLNGDYVIDIRGNILFEGIALESGSVNAVCDVTLSDPVTQADLPSVTICFAQDGEGLWDVAKRYSASVKAIMEENNVTENSNLSGKRLIVPKNRGI